MNSENISIEIDLINNIDLDQIIEKYSYKSSCLNFGNLSSSLNKMILLLSKVELDIYDKELLLGRVVDIYTNINRKYKRYSTYYTFAVLTTTVFSILTTTFLSFTNNDCVVRNGIYWSTWAMSLSVSIINAFSTFYKWDRKYILLFQIINKLEYEIWTYIELVDTYNKNNCKEHKFFHKEKLELFLTRIEKISKTLNKNLLDLEEKTDDKNTSNNMRATRQSFMYSSIDPYGNTGTIHNTNVNPYSLKSSRENNIYGKSETDDDGDISSKSNNSTQKKIILKQIIPEDIICKKHITINTNTELNTNTSELTDVHINKTSNKINRRNKSILNYDNDIIASVNYELPNNSIETSF